MKKIQLAFFTVIVFSFCFCSTKQNTKSTDTLYSSSWELDYISGSQTTFEDLYPEKKPQVTFDKANSTLMGNTSCNGFSSKYRMRESQVTFEDGIKTMIFCEGGGEETFLNTLKKANKYSLDSDGKLILLADDIVLMRFKKIPLLN